MTTLRRTITLILIPISFAFQELSTLLQVDSVNGCGSFLANGCYESASDRAAAEYSLKALTTISRVKCQRH